MDGGAVSAMAKTRTESQVRISAMGIEGDEIADPKHHGGLDRALLLYPIEHYAILKRRYPDIDLNPGAFGENIASTMLTEGRVCIGDVFRCGSALIQISQPRSPCFKLGVRVKDKQCPRFIQDNAISGYFFRVLEPGLAEPIDTLELVDRPHGELTVREAHRIYFAKTIDVKNLLVLLKHPALCQRWKNVVRKRLSSHRVESWHKRLLGQE